MKPSLLVIGIATGCIIGCTNSRPTSLPRLDELARLASPQGTLAQAVCRTIKQQGERPEEFYAEIDQDSQGNIIFHLWHRSAFPFNSDVAGNPGGKSRDVYLDKTTQKVTKILLWQ